MNKKEIEKIVKSGSIDEKKKLVELLDSENPETAEYAQDAIINGTDGRDKKELVKKLMDTAVSSDNRHKAQVKRFRRVKTSCYA